MRTIDSQLAHGIFAEMKLNKSLQKRLMLSGLTGTSAPEWRHLELFGLPTRDGTAGVLFIDLQGTMYAAPYEIGPVSNKTTGITKPVICDFCKTWQTGSRAGSITFRPDRRSINSVSYLCCLDLKCSLHVRTLTLSAKTSRSQLREDISPEHRIQRLEDRLATLIEKLRLQPLTDIDSVKQQ